MKRTPRKLKKINKQRLECFNKERLWKYPLTKFPYKGFSKFIFGFDYDQNDKNNCRFYYELM